MTQLAEIEEEPLPTSPEELFTVFEKLEIDYTLHHHDAVFTVEESDKVCGSIEGTHCRNLFFRDKKKSNYLLVLQNETDVDIKKLPDVMGSARLSFGSAERLWKYLGVRPGSVCPFSIINDTHKDVQIILDQSMMERDVVNYHPLLNTMTVSLSPHDLLRFIENCGREARIVDLSSAAP